MDTDIRALLAIAQAYFDAAYEMDADKFASIFSNAQKNPIRVPHPPAAPADEIAR